MADLAQESTQAKARGGSWLNIVILVAVTALVVAGVWFFQCGGDEGDFSAVDLTPASGPGPEVGQPAPDFQGLLLDDELVDLSELKGRPVWVVFNATWCANCRAEAPEVQALHEDDRIEVVSVWLRESTSQVQPYMERAGFDFTSMPDPSGQVSSSYRVSGVPSHYLIDAEGNIHSMHVGALTSEQFERYAEELIAS